MDCFLNSNIISLFQVYQKNWASLLTCLKKECYSYFINHFWFWIFYIIMMGYLHLCFILRLFYLIKLGRIEIGHHYNHLLLTFIFSLFINNLLNFIIIIISLISGCRLNFNFLFINDHWKTRQLAPSFVHGPSFN